MPASTAEIEKTASQLDEAALARELDERGMPAELDEAALARELDERGMPAELDEATPLK